LNISFIVPIISYGKYSKTFINYLLYTSQNQELENYLTILKLKWVLKSDDLLVLSEKLLKKTQNKGLQGLIKTIMLDVSKRNKNDDLNRKIYLELIRKFKNVPLPYRNIVGKSIKSNHAYNCKKITKEFRMWSEIHDSNELDTAILLNAEARKCIVNGEREKAVQYFSQVHEHALKYPHPTFILAGINNVAWHSYKLQTKESRKAVNTLLYDCGYFFDEESAVINSFDTTLTVLKATKDMSYFEMAEIMLIFYNRLLVVEPKYKKRFVNTIKYAKELSPSELKSGGRKDEIRNTYGLQNFLKKNIAKVKDFATEYDISVATFYRILRDKTDNIKVETLKKIVKALGLDELSFDYPRTINLVIQMIKEDETFERNWQKISHFSAFELKSLFLKGFMTLVSLEGIDLAELFKLTEKDREKLFEFIKSDPKLIAFFNRCVQYEFEPEEVNPYYKARLDLMNLLFSEMGAMHHITSLMKLYASVESPECLEQLNIYFRQYVRYSTTPWRFDVEDVLSKSASDTDYKKIALFCKKLNISELFGYLCTWQFEGNERKQLVEVLC
jgi:transcriptional regulator with XRE-family HTH domain